MGLGLLVADLMARARAARRHRALHLWRRHPAVAGAPLRRRDRAADFLKRWFGTWTALGAVAGVIAAWVAWQRFGRAFDPYPFILLNLCLSCLAAVQGIILQISANRGDRIAARVALHTENNTEALLGMQREQTEILRKLDVIAHVTGADGGG